METQQLPEAFGRYGEADQGFQGGGSEEFGGAAAEEEQQQRRWTTGRKVTLLLVVVLVVAAAGYYAYRLISRSATATPTAAAAAGAGERRGPEARFCVVSSWNERERRYDLQSMRGVEDVELDREQFVLVGGVSDKETTEELKTFEEVALYCIGRDDAVLAKIPRPLVVEVVEGASNHRACVNFREPMYRSIVLEREADGLLPFYEHDGVFWLVTGQETRPARVHLVSTDAAAGGGGGGGGVALVWNEPEMDGLWELLGKPAVVRDPGALLHGQVVRMEATPSSFRLSWTDDRLVDVTYPNLPAKRWATAKTPVVFVLNLDRTRYQVFERRYKAAKGEFWLAGNPRPASQVSSGRMFVVVPNEDVWVKTVTGFPKLWGNPTYADYPDLERHLGGQVDGIAVEDENSRVVPISQLADPNVWARISGDLYLRAVEEEGLIADVDNGLKVIHSAAELAELYRTHRPHGLNRRMGKLTPMKTLSLNAASDFTDRIQRQLTVQNYAWLKK